MKEFGLRLVSLEPAQVMVWEWEVRGPGDKMPAEAGTGSYAWKTER